VTHDMGIIFKEILTLENKFEEKDR